MADRLLDPLPAPPDTARRTVLVADDDVSTREFLAAALKTLGYLPTLAADGREALEIASRLPFDALLLDCRMPGAGAEDVLASLRMTASAASRLATAFATSAEITPVQRRRLLDAGFAGVIEKPCRVAALGQALSSLSERASTAKVLDDDEALAATGDANTMRALRGLLRDELATLEDELGVYAGQPGAFIERLHRLRSACGFCGAARLGVQVKALQKHLVHQGHATGPALERFREELRATMTALDASQA
ncbi:response regulator [Luteibacter sp. CQ10]|uniref:response regulator n=1 Tax=Luteibacter sp. CQ10 TaxID=2805821 RepID=UPI0034A1E64A